MEMIHSNDRNGNMTVGNHKIGEILSSNVQVYWVIRVMWICVLLHEVGNAIWSFVKHLFGASMRGFAQVLSHICTHAFKFRVISRTITCILQRSFYLAFVWGSQTRCIANSLRTQIYRCITQSYLHLLPQQHIWRDSFQGWMQSSTKWTNSTKLKRRSSWNVGCSLISKCLLSSKWRIY